MSRARYLQYLPFLECFGGSGDASEFRAEVPQRRLLCRVHGFRGGVVDRELVLAGWVRVVPAVGADGEVWGSSHESKCRTSKLRSLRHPREPGNLLKRFGEALVLVSEEPVRARDQSGAESIDRDPVSCKPPASLAREQKVAQLRVLVRFVRVVGSAVHHVEATVAFRDRVFQPFHAFAGGERGLGAHVPAPAHRVVHRARRHHQP
mmetsp:Transcript_52459/g.104185  ORF Transcript_52459/g.104185 Transcript_52459/m.104185 type:complete len:206 (-) Transcript_52459:474-1091(-)